jgi:hypothetical protein
MNIQQVEIVSIAPTAIWIESDLLGARHVVVQHEGCEPFTYATFNYHHLYTDNASTHRAAESLALQLGAMAPVEHKTRMPK